MSLQILNNSDGVIIGRTLYVPTEFTTVQAALDWLADTPSKDCKIFVASGVTETNITNITSQHNNIASLTIASETPGTVVSYGTGFLLDSYKGILTIQDIRNSASSSLPIFTVNNSFLVLENVGPFVLNGTETSIIQATSSTVQISNSLIYGYSSIRSTAGIKIIQSYGSINDTIIYGDQCGVEVDKRSYVSIFDSESYATHAQGSSYSGVFVNQSSRLQTFNSTLKGSDYGVYVRQSSYLIDEASTFIGTRVDGVRTQIGGGVMFNAAATIKNCGMYGVRALYGGVLNDTEICNFQNIGIGNYYPSSLGVLSSDNSYRAS